MNADIDFLLRLVKKARVDVLNGYLKIVPFSNKPLPKAWLNKERERILNMISHVMQDLLFEYCMHSTGHYAVKECVGKKPGLTLHFLSYGVLREEYVAHFNVELTRKRNTKHGFEGKNLRKKNQFRIKGKLCSFYQFWDRTGLKHQKSSSYFEYMGNLKPLIFTAKIKHRNKLENKTITPYTLKHEDLCKQLNL